MTAVEMIKAWEVRELTLEDLAMLSDDVLAEIRPSPLPVFASRLDLKLTQTNQPKRSDFSRESHKYPATLDNAKLAINRLGIRLRYNAFKRRIEFEGYQKPIGETFDETSLKLRNYILEKYEFDPGSRNVDEATQIIAMQNTYDPVCDYLDGLEWDGLPRLETWLVDFMGAEDSALTRAIARAVLIGAVRRARRPGCKFDYMMVLEGSQGTGKSTALKILAGGDEYFADGIDFLLGYKDQQELLQGVWIAEAAEMEGLGKTDVRRVKQFVSKTHDKARPAFAKTVEDMPRRCILVGTTNDEQYLSDPTGNRRFWPVRTGRIDLAGLKAARDQLWAEAAWAEPDEPDPITIPSELWAEAAVRQEERVTADPWEDLLEEGLPKFAKLVEGEFRIPSADVAQEVLGLGAREMRMADAKRIASCMRRLGWSGPQPFAWKGKTARGYVKADIGMGGLG